MKIKSAVVRCQREPDCGPKDDSGGISVGGFADAGHSKIWLKKSVIHGVFSGLFFNASRSGLIAPTRLR
jgi:hypothetical protein